MSFFTHGYILYNNSYIFLMHFSNWIKEMIASSRSTCWSWRELGADPPFLTPWGPFWEFRHSYIFSYNLSPTKPITASIIMGGIVVKITIVRFHKISPSQTNNKQIDNINMQEANICEYDAWPCSVINQVLLSTTLNFGNQLLTQAKSICQFF